MLIKVILGHGLNKKYQEIWRKEYMRIGKIVV